MTASIFSLLCLSIAAGLVELLLPHDAEKGTKRCLKILISLAVLLALLTPFLSFLDSADAFFTGDVGEIVSPETDYGAVLEDAVSRRSKQELENGIYGYLKEQFQIERENADVSVSFEKDGALRRVSVILSGKALTVDPDKIEAALFALFGCDIEVR